MTPEEKSLLERTLKLADENNAILRGLRRSNRVSTVMRVIYWGIIILLSVGAYYYIQPYVNVLTGFMGSTTNADGTSAFSPNAIQNDMNSVKQMMQKTQQ